MSDVRLNQEEIDHLAQRHEWSSVRDILIEAIELVPTIALACSFGAEDMVLLDVLMQVEPNTKVFYLDTDVLFKETYELIDAAVKKYTIPNLIAVRSELTLTQQAAQFGEELWESQPDTCCAIRKVRPLTKILSTLEGWITGIRRDQSPTRAAAQVFEEDAKFGLVKINPLVRWTEKEVWNYLYEHEVPYNRLHDQGYPSIGCICCTKAVKPGEDPRSGRWSGFAKTECGLHR